MENKKMSTKTLVLSAFLTAIVVVLQLFAEHLPIKVGPCTLSFVLIPIVIGAATCEPIIGAWLGFVFSAVVLLCPSTQLFYAISIPGTILTVLVKGTLAGLISSLVYKLISKKSKLFGVISAAIFCPVINTGIFLLGCRLFFFEAVSQWAGGANVISYMFLGLAGFNFLFELVSNIVLSPAIVRLLNIKKA